jgi:hypothetical protein
MPYYEIHALDPVTNVLVTSVIQTDGTPAMVREEVRKGGLHPRRIVVLDSRQVDIYERMGIMARKRNLVAMAMGGDKPLSGKPRILWGRVILAIALPLLAASALLLLL